MIVFTDTLSVEKNLKLRTNGSEKNVFFMDETTFIKRNAKVFCISNNSQVCK